MSRSDPSTHGQWEISRRIAEKKGSMKYGELTLGQVEAVTNKLGGMVGVLQFLSGEIVVVAKAKAKKLLEFLACITVSAVKKFVAADYFKHGEMVEGVKCYLGDNFTKNFLKKVEENVPGCEIRVHKLLKASRDLGIRAEIGEEREETFLAHLWQCLKLQPNGEEGTLLTNGYANIFYIRDTEGNLWAVRAYCYGADWHVYAYSVGYSFRWLADIRVASR